LCYRPTSPKKILTLVDNPNAGVRLGGVRSKRTLEKGLSTVLIRRYEVYDHVDRLVDIVTDKRMGRYIQLGRYTDRYRYLTVIVENDELISGLAVVRKLGNGGGLRIRHLAVDLTFSNTRTIPLLFDALRTAALAHGPLNVWVHDDLEYLRQFFFDYKFWPTDSFDARDRRRLEWRVGDSVATWE
jgi:hypothetical protein